MKHTLAQELLQSLTADKPSISPKFFYDEVGSHLFDVITLLEEYYPTRTEKWIMDTYRREIANTVAHCDVLVDLGAGNCAKGSQLFNSIQPKQYRALDISKEYLEAAVADLQKQFPQIEMSAHAIDLSLPLAFPELQSLRKVFFYPGSSIGNFDPEKADQFFSNLAHECYGNGGLLIGVDLVKDTETLHLAYNDSLGVTAAFNLNALLNVNRLVGSNFELQDWEHHAFYNVSQSHIEMHLRARSDVQVTLPGNGRPDHIISFKAGDLIHTENSYKYTQENFVEKLSHAGFTEIQCWTDPNKHFLVCFANV
ncbi:L-histidine N(alpha)-methyltransferase [Polynucleobacter sp. AP-Elch-400A-B2]|uniref:L-histidine N(alpha)-methyltransferase n=1 Tax=Polynucleobacter sp. AP-Elch-400A-B2 TaxID=2576930 RepID=UPI001BFDA3A8|nr:L-histidine N(alpha)-methyltransferase [Polynucleobacter sp. AP-Elch-400A-B2]QWE25163.1 L-histidine N(alpha)-methyltransferase [Polynucleobacter sp. AP-Elch-400A-B2]